MSKQRGKQRGRQREPAAKEDNRQASAPWEQSLGAAGAMLLLAAGPMIPPESAAEFGGHLFWALGWLLLLAAGPVVVILRRDRLPIAWQRSDLVLLTGAVWMAAAAAWGGLFANPRAGFNMAWFWVGAAACLLVLRQTLRRASLQRVALALMLGSAIGLALHGVTQFAVTMPAMVRQYDANSEHERARMLREMGVDPAPNSPSRTQFENRLRSTEPYATFALANSLAGVLAPWLVCCLALVLLPGASRKLIVFSLAAAAVLASCLVLTKSRTGLVAAAAGVGALFLWDFRGPRRLGWRIPAGMLAACCLLVAGGVAVGALDKEVVTQAALSLSYRWEYWQATLQMIADHPWLGCGSGSFQDYYGQYQHAEASELIAEPHNFVLELAATGGVVAACLWTGAWAAKVFRRPDSPPADASSCDALPMLAGAATGCVLGMLLAMVLGFPPEMLGPAPVALVCALAGVGLAAWLQHELARVADRNWAAWLCAVAPIALSTSLLNLLAAGGVSFWAVLQSTLFFTVLCGVGANRRKMLDADARGRLLLAAGAPLALAIGVILNGVNPRLRSQAEIYQLQSAPNATAAQRAYDAARAADPWSGMPAQILAQARCAQQRRDEKTWSLFAAAHQLDQRNHRLLTDWADEQLRASRFGQDRKLWERAIQHYREAETLAPRGPAWARLAWALQFGGQQEEAGDWARRALKWHERHPHREQQLDRLRVPAPEGSVTALEGCRTILRQNA